MSDAPQIKLELLRLAKPDIPMPGIDVWISRAKELEAYVLGDGPLPESPSKAEASGPSNSPDNPPRKAARQK